MNTSNVSPQSNIEQIRELLSPYLDNEVSTTERKLVEQALQSSSELRADLESLRQTVTLLKAMPAMSAPRPFTLTAADIPAQATASQPGWLILPGWLSNLASMALLLGVLVLGGLFLFSPMKSGSNSPDLAAYQAAPVQEIAAAPTLEAVKAEARKEEVPQEKVVAAPTATEAVMAAEAAKIAPKEEVPPSASENADAASEPSAKMAAAPAPAEADSAAQEPAAASGGAAATNEEVTSLSAPTEAPDQTNLMSTESATLQPAPEAAPMSMAAPEAESKSSEIAAVAQPTVIVTPATVEPTATTIPPPTAPAQPVSSNTVWLITGVLAALVLVGGIISWLKHSGKL